LHRAHPPELTRQERDAIGRFAHDVPALWEAPATTARDRHEMGRLWRERVTIDVPGEREHVSVTIHWAGGVRSEHRVMRPVARYDQLSTYQVLLDRIDTLRRRGLRCAPVAAHLNRDGFAPPTRTERFSGSMIARLLRHRGLHGPRPRTMVDTTVLQPHEYWLTDVASTMNMPMATVHTWHRMGWVHRRNVAVAAGRWAIGADDNELARLRRLRTYTRQWPEPRDPAALTTPTPRDDARRTTATAGTAVPRV
jgi:hypothetical protein